MKSGRGGKRKGAGRPAGSTNKTKGVRFTPTVKKSTLEWINDQPGSQGKVIDKLVITDRQLSACKEALDRCRTAQKKATIDINHEGCIQALSRLKVDLEGIFECEF